VVDTLLADLPDSDLAVLDYAGFKSALMNGVAPHHAGMVPAFKEAVEVCFQKGLLKVVIATETLALGINMPARTVVIERLEKWNGVQHELLTPGQYTQLTGRAGRRGIDQRGNAVVLYQRDIDFRTVASLVGTRTYPLSSSFAPSYNMAVNLLRRHDREQAEALLGASFAQFQADRAVAHLGKELVELEQGMAGYARNLTCERGDWDAYWQLRREVSRREKAEARERRTARDRSLYEGITSLQPGDVLHLPALGDRGLAAVVGVSLTKKGVPLAQVVTDDRALQRLGPRELDTAPRVVDRVQLPNRGNPRQSDYRDVVASKLRGVDVPPPQPRVAPAADSGPSRDVERLRAELRAHPCHACDEREDHERWQYRYDELADQADRLRRHISRRTGSLVRQFDRILAILRELDYVDDEPAPTEAGLTLAGIYSEVDLLVAEALRRGLLEGVTAPELAALGSLFLYEPRGGEVTTDPELATPRIVSAHDALEALARELRGREREAGLTPLRDLDGGFMGAAHRWARGDDLDEAMGDLELTGGDFVRNVKQVADLLGQLRDVADPELATTARLAIDQLRRGIVEA
jgi:ATP-dependent RNA helicase HelY